MLKDRSKEPLKFYSRKKGTCQNDEQGWIWNGYIFTTLCIFPLINISPHLYVTHSLPLIHVFASSSLLLPAAVRRFLLILPPLDSPSILFAYVCVGGNEKTLSYICKTSLRNTQQKHSPAAKGLKVLVCCCATLFQTPPHEHSCCTR